MVEAKAITDSKMDPGKMDPFFVVMSILSPSLYNRIPKRNILSLYDRICYH